MQSPGLIGKKRKTLAQQLFKRVTQSKILVASVPNEQKLSQVVETVGMPRTQLGVKDALSLLKPLNCLAITAKCLIQSRQIGDLNSRQIVTTAMDLECLLVSPLQMKLRCS